MMVVMVMVMVVMVKVGEWGYKLKCLFVFFFVFFCVFVYVCLSPGSNFLLETDWVNLSKREGKDGVFQGLAGLLQGIS